MTMGLSLLLTATGAILIWAVNATVSGVEIHTVGAILFVIGIVGFLVSLAFWSSWTGSEGGAPSDRTTVIRERSEPRI